MPNVQTMQAMLDTRAIEIAAQALGKMNSHEADCVRRYDEIIDSTKELRNEIREANREQRDSNSRLHSRMNLFLVSLVGGLFVLVGFLFKLQMGW
jgi:hypothetical protein